MEKIEIISVCRDYLYPDEDLLKNLDNITDSKELILISGRVKSISGHHRVRGKMSVVSMDGFDDDNDIDSLYNRLSLAQSVGDKIVEKRITIKIDEVILDGLKEDRDLNSLHEKENKAISNNAKNCVAEQLNAVVQEKLPNENRVECLEEMLKMRLRSHVTVHSLEIKIDKLLDVIDGLDDDTDEASLFQRLENSHSEDSQIKIKERIDEVRGVFESINSYGFKQLVGLHKLALSWKATSQIRGRMDFLIMEIEPTNPPEWFAELLNNPVGYLDNRAIKEKAEEIVERN